MGLDFMRSLPPTYHQNCDQSYLQLAAKAARKAIQDCDRDGNVLAAWRFRQLCHLIDDVNPSDDYDAHQRLLEHVIAVSDIASRYPLSLLVDHNMPEVYTTWSLALSCMKMFASGVTQFENDSGSSALSFEGKEQLLKLLEPHKGKKLEDKAQWVCL